MTPKPPLDLTDTIDRKLFEERRKHYNAIKGPRHGDWVVLPNETRLKWPNGREEVLPAGAEYRLGGLSLRMRNGVDKECHATLTVDTIFDDGHGGSFFMRKDGTISKSGGNSFYQVSEDAKLIDTGRTKPGEFWFFHHDVIRGGNGREFEIECRVYEFSGTILRHR
jgi:hypothetical protein